MTPLFYRSRGEGNKPPWHPETGGLSFQEGEIEGKKGERTGAIRMARFSSERCIEKRHNLVALGKSPPAAKRKEGREGGIAVPCFRVVRPG